jgi:hypothetical protein
MNPLHLRTQGVHLLADRGTATGYDGIFNLWRYAVPLPAKVNDEPTDQLRSALHSIYLAMHSAMRAYPIGFDKNHATRMLTSLMGSRYWSWPVVGVTTEALQLFADNGYKSSNGQIQRGHLIARSATAMALFYDQAVPPNPRDSPLTEADFFDEFSRCDKTVLMTRSQNPGRTRTGRHGTSVAPKYISFDNDAGLFSCASLVGWKHGADEIAFLKRLCDEHGIVPEAMP